MAKLVNVGALKKSKMKLLTTACQSRRSKLKDKSKRDQIYLIGVFLQVVARNFKDLTLVKPE